MIERMRKEIDKELRKEQAGFRKVKRNLEKDSRKERDREEQEGVAELEGSRGRCQGLRVPI